MDNVELPFGTFRINGKPVTEEEFCSRRPADLDSGSPMTSPPGVWPQKCDTAGVNPNDIPEAMAEAKARGVPTDFDPETGQIIFRDRAHRKKYCEAFAYFDKDGGYGDPQRREERWHGHHVDQGR